MTSKTSKYIIIGLIALVVIIITILMILLFTSSNNYACVINNGKATCEISATGPYSSEKECKASCGYKCINNTCTAYSGTGAMSSSECEGICKNALYTCKINGLDASCEVSPSGKYTSQSNCKDNCGYYCKYENSTFICMPKEGTSLYSIDECSGFCNNTTQRDYNCVIDNVNLTAECVPVAPGDGKYTSHDECKDSCGYFCSEEKECLPVEGIPAFSEKDDCENKCGKKDTGNDCLPCTKESNSLDCFKDCSFKCNTTDLNCAAISGSGGYEKKNECVQNCVKNSNFYVCGPDSCDNGPFEYPQDFISRTECDQCKSWKCVDNECKQTAGNSGSFDQSGCSIECSPHRCSRLPAGNSPNSYECVPDASSQYRSKSACSNACKFHYKCQSNGCVRIDGDDNGPHDITECQSTCKSYNCNGNEPCTEIQGTSGTYTDSETCKTACWKYSCQLDVNPLTNNKAYVCKPDPSSAYDKSACIATCQNSYHCNINTKQCNPERNQDGEADFNDCIGPCQTYGYSCVQGVCNAVPNGKYTNQTSPIGCNSAETCQSCEMMCNNYYCAPSVTLVAPSNYAETNLYSVFPELYPINLATSICNNAKFFLQSHVGTNLFLNEIGGYDVGLRTKTNMCSINMINMPYFYYDFGDFNRYTLKYSDWSNNQLFLKTDNGKDMTVWKAQVDDQIKKTVICYLQPSGYPSKKSPAIQSVYIVVYYIELNTYGFVQVPNEMNVQALRVELSSTSKFSQSPNNLFDVIPWNGSRSSFC